MVGSPPTASSDTSSDTAVAATLKLRLLGGAHDGRVVELAARLCTLGSAPQCTLRLRAAGIEPVHCSIDRTGEQTRIERQAGESWLNGQPFEHAALRVGDRLRLGPVEFEVLADPRPRPVVVPATAARPEVVRCESTSNAFQAEEHRIGAVNNDAFKTLDVRFQQLEDRLNGLDRVLADGPAPTAPQPLANRELDDAQRRCELEQLKSQLSSEVAERVAQVAGEVVPRVAAEVTVGLDEKLAARVAGEVASQFATQVQSRLTDEVAACTATAVHRAAESLASQAAQDVADRVTAAVTPIVAAHEAWGQQRLDWQHEQQSVRDGLGAYTSQLEERLESLSRLEQALQAQRTRLPEESPATAQVDGRLTHLECELVALHEQHTVWTIQRDEFRHELQLLREHLADRSDKLGHQLVKLEAKWESFQHEQRRLHSIQTPEPAPLAVRAEHVEHRLAGIRAEREAFEHERHHPVAERTHVHPGEHVKQIDDRLAEIQARRQTDKRGRHQLWPEDCSDREADPQSTASDENDSTEPSDTLPRVAHDEPAMAYAGEPREIAHEASEAATDASSGEMIEVHAPPATPPTPSGLLRPAEAEEPFASPVESEDSSQREDESAPAEDPRADGLASAAPAEEAPSHASAIDDAKKEDSEESIDDYMARLMQRVKSIAVTGGTKPAGESSKAAPPTAPRESEPREMGPRRPAVAVVKAPSDDDPGQSNQNKILDLSELNPRGIPAELTSNISAMRDLANLSARSALDAHSRKRLNSTIYSKLSVAIAALLSAVALTWFARNGSAVTYAAALVGTLVAAVWGLEYLVLSGNWYFQRKPAKEDAPPPQA